MPSRLTKAKNHEGKIVGIDDVYNGAKCNCFCPVCGNSLIARHGAHNEHHFAHSNKMECVTAPETALHLLAKEILKENKVLVIYSEKIFEYENVELEKRINNIIADGVLKGVENDLIVEIVVTNPLSTEKKGILRKIGIPVLEISLRGVDYNISKPNLINKVLYNEENRTYYDWNEDKELEEEVLLSAFQAPDDQGDTIHTGIKQPKTDLLRKSSGWIAPVLLLLLGGVLFFTRSPGRKKRKRRR